MHRTLVAGSIVILGSLASLGACGGGQKTADSPTSTSSSVAGSPSASGSDSASAIKEDTFIEEASGTGDKGSAVRIYSLDVTKEDRIASPTDKGAGSTKVLFLRVQIKFPIPKVTPDGAREPHAINRALWDARGELARCYYGKKGSGPGGVFGEERSFVAALDIDKSGAVTAASVEKADDALTSAAGFTDCILANVKGMSFGVAGDASHVRFKLKFQTIDGAGLPDFKPPPAKAGG